MKTAPGAEIIEVIDDDSDVFGGATSNPAIGDTVERPWAGPLAAAALLMVIGFGVATSASTTGAPRTASVPTTAIAPTPQPKPPTSTPDAAVPYFVADPPGFALRYANLQHPDRVPFQGDGYELWATDGASASIGSWFAVTTYRDAPVVYAPNAYRLETDQSSIAISHIAGGQSVAQFTVAGGFGVSVTSFGWSDQDLVRLAGSVQTDGSTVDFTDTWFATDHQMVTSVQPWLAVQSIAAEQIGYVSTDVAGVDVVITVGKRRPPSEVGLPTDRRIALHFLLDNQTSFDVEAGVAVAGTIVGQSDYRMATWTSNDNVITVTAPIALRELIDIARTVHEVSPAEWDDARAHATTKRRESSRPMPARLPSIASGIDAASNAWTIDVMLATVDRQQQISWQWEGNGLGSRADDNAQINTVVDDDRTYVLADLPRTVATTAQLRISRPGHEPIVVPFSDADPELDRTFAAYAFSEATQYSAEIIGADGAALATWPAV